MKWLVRLSLKGVLAVLTIAVSLSLSAFAQDKSIVVASTTSTQESPLGPVPGHLAVVLDWFSRRVLSWGVSITMEEAFCVETLEDALARHGKPDIFNTDQGSQFTGSAFTGVLASNGIAISMDGKGAWRDNVFVERLWRSVKYEECICGPTKVYPRLALRSAVTWTFIMADVPTRALTAPRPIKPTSPRCHSAWQPNPGRGSTYRRGKSV